MTQDNTGKDRGHALVRARLALVFAALALSGCLGSSHSDRAVLSVDLFWDEDPSASHFRGGDCSSAAVSWMEWHLEDASGATVASPDPHDSTAKDCKNGFDFYDLAPGDYTLVITGHDASDKPLWSTSCQGLTLQRFAASFECDIDR